MEFTIEKKLGIAILSIILLGSLELFGKEDIATIASYDNYINEISHHISSGNKHVVHTVFTQEPICYLVPMSYESMYDSSLSKSYFFPRTKFRDNQMKYLYKNLNTFLQLAGIDIDIQEFRYKHHGIMIHFKMKNQQHVYEIEKIIDLHKKTVDFVIVEKI